MATHSVTVYSPEGQKVGYFKEARIDKVAEGHFSVEGEFYGPNGESVVRAEYNPEVLPYNAEVAGAEPGAEKLVRVYVQRGRQPVIMTGVTQDQIIEKRW